MYGYSPKTPIGWLATVSPGEQDVSVSIPYDMVPGEAIGPGSKDFPARTPLFLVVFLDFVFWKGDVTYDGHEE